MSTINLKELERKAYLSFFEDGLLDILLGLWLLGLAWLMWSDSAALIGVLALLIVPLFGLLKRWVTIPRIGVVRLKPSQKRRAGWQMTLGVGVFFLMLVMSLGLFANGRADNLQAFLSQNIDFIFGALIALPLALAALVTGVWRWLVYAAVLLAIFAVGQFAPFDAPAATFISGVILALSGLGVLIGFMRRYPRPLEEM